MKINLLLKIKSLLYLFVLTLLAGSVWAVEKTVPSPSDALRSITEFFSNLTITGNTDAYYFLVFLLYLIILVAIFAELVKRLPLFGASGELSTAGKWFVGAAAGLATLGIFLAQQVTGKNAIEMLSSLVAPFGVWGGVAIGGIVAYISYEGLRSFPFFEKHKIIVAALAFAIGMMLVGVLAGWPSLLSWGYLIMGVAILIAAAENWVRNRKDDGGAGGGRESGGGAEPPDTGKARGKEEGDVTTIEEFTEREWHDLKIIQKEIEDAKISSDLEHIKNNKVRKLERVERRMNKRFKRLEEDGKKLMNHLSADKAAEVEKELKDFEKYNKAIVAGLSKGGLLENALTSIDPADWVKELFGEKATGKDPLQMRKQNSLAVVKAMIKWDEGFYLKLKKYHEQLEKK